ncbi:Crp/Fnr family transcriptional regulator [Thalassomonas sp. RHCl1]|uniref:Crp/Fnr family transcriptional regulator n=1 Tax=Thalassomonas sp. RHCl1 TaxID=2995320 RepID=UPI00248BAC2E|nr:Crp/Fnr family transcriptional regulator [Thalassomonas sp. RHCl1]
MDQLALAEKICWPTDLSAQLKQQLINSAKIVNISGNDELVNSNLAHQGISYILEGTMTICLQTPKLKAINSIVKCKGEWFGNYEPRTSDYTPFFITEIEPVTLVHFSTATIHSLASEHMEMYKWFHSMSFSAKAKWLQAQIISHENVLVRVVYFLLELSSHLNFLAGQTPRISITQQQISRITGIARQRVNEVIKSLEKENLVSLERHCIYLTNIEQLGKKLDGIDLSIRDPRGVIFL